MSKFLVGKVIRSVQIADDKKALLFICDDGKHVVKTDGDCCSNSWVEHIELTALGFPCVVVDTFNLELPENTSVEGEYDEDCISHYGFQIRTTKGDIVISYRNSSNGYYGGNLSWPDEDFYGGVFEQNVSSENWIEINN